jgi:hypothetical protein
VLSTIRRHLNASGDRRMCQKRRIGFCRQVEKKMFRSRLPLTEQMKLLEPPQLLQERKIGEIAKSLLKCHERSNHWSRLLRFDPRVWQHHQGEHRIRCLRLKKSATNTESAEQVAREASLRFNVQVLGNTLRTMRRKGSSGYIGPGRKPCIADGDMDLISDGIIMWLTISMMNGEPEKKNSNMEATLAQLL